MFLVFFKSIKLLKIAKEHLHGILNKIYVLLHLVFVLLHFNVLSYSILCNVFLLDKKILKDTISLIELSISSFIYSMEVYFKCLTYISIFVYC